MMPAMCVPNSPIFFWMGMVDGRKKGSLPGKKEWRRGVLGRFSHLLYPTYFLFFSSLSAISHLFMLHVFIITVSVSLSSIDKCREEVEKFFLEGHAPSPREGGLLLLREEGGGDEICLATSLLLLLPWIGQEQPFQRQ